MNLNTRLCTHSCAKGWMKRHQILIQLRRRTLSEDFCSISAEMNSKIGKCMQIRIIFRRIFDEHKLSPYLILPSFSVSYIYIFRSTISQQYENRLGEEITEDEAEAKYSAKRKMLGNIKFIGELGKLQIVHDSILHRLV